MYEKILLIITKFLNRFFYNDIINTVFLDINFKDIINIKVGDDYQLSLSEIKFLSKNRTLTIKYKKNNKDYKLNFINDKLFFKRLINNHLIEKQDYDISSLVNKKDNQITLEYPKFNLLLKDENIKIQSYNTKQLIDIFPDTKKINQSNKIILVVLNLEYHTFYCQYRLLCIKNNSNITQIKSGNIVNLVIGKRTNFSLTPGNYLLIGTTKTKIIFQLADYLTNFMIASNNYQEYDKSSIKIIPTKMNIEFYNSDKLNNYEILISPKELDIESFKRSLQLADDYFDSDYKKVRLTSARYNQQRMIFRKKLEKKQYSSEYDNFEITRFREVK